MTFEQLVENYRAENERDAAVGDDGAKNMIAMFDSAKKMSEQAKREFVSVFKFEPALDGEIYLGMDRLVDGKFETLRAEAKQYGIKIFVTNGKRQKIYL